MLVRVRAPAPVSTSAAETNDSVAELTGRLQRTLLQAHLEVSALPYCPQIRLALLNADFPTGPLPYEVMQAVIREPAYWAFCWGSGLALARLILRHPEWVAGRDVVDLGSGSGVVAIAATLAGAASVTACDTDEDALAATATNARLNAAALQTTATLPPSCDLILMADVLYDRANLALLSVAKNHAREILVADSRVKTLPDDTFVEVAREQALTFPNLGEFDEFSEAVVHRWAKNQST